jgi:transposase
MGWALTGCFWASGSGDPDDEVSAPGPPRNRCATCTSPTIRPTAELLLDKTIEGCRQDVVPEIRTLGRTLGRWRTEIRAHHATGASNGPTEGLNLLVKKVKRARHGFRSFANYRLRILLHAGGVD